MTGALIVRASSPPRASAVWTKGAQAIEAHKESRNSIESITMPRNIPMLLPGTPRTLSSSVDVEMSTKE